MKEEEPENQKARIVTKLLNDKEGNYKHLISDCEEHLQRLIG